MPTDKTSHHRSELKTAMFEKKYFTHLQRSGAMKRLKRAFNKAARAQAKRVCRVYQAEENTHG